MLGRGEEEKNKPENTEVLMQTEKQFVRAFRTSSELKGTSRRSKKSSPYCMIVKGPKLEGYTVNQFGISSRSVKKICLHAELPTIPKLQER